MTERLCSDFCDLVMSQTCLIRYAAHKSFEMHIKALVVFSSFSGPPPEKAETVPCPGPGGRWSGLDSAGVGSGGPAPGAMGEAACFFAFRSLAC